MVLQEALINFHPEFPPIQWRILIVQVLACRLLLKNKTIKEFLEGDVVLADPLLFDWRNSKEAVTDELTQPFAVAHTYLASRLRANEYT